MKEIWRGFFLINCCTINHFPWLRLHGKRWRFQLFEKCEIVITHGQYSFVLSWANTIENCLSFSCCNERRPISPFWLDILLVYHYTGIGSKGMEAKTTDIWEHKRILRNYMPGTSISPGKWQAEWNTYAFDKKGKGLNSSHRVKMVSTFLKIPSWPMWPSPP